MRASQLDLEFEAYELMKTLIHKDLRDYWPESELSLNQSRTLNGSGLFPIPIQEGGYTI